MYPKESASDFLQDLIFKVGGFQEGDGFGGGTGKAYEVVRLHLKMEGWPIFRGELLVSGRVCFVGVVDD